MEKGHRLMDKKYDSINFNYLKFFIEAAECSSLQEVANKMGYEISNVSSSIANLENQLGVKLFTRNPLKLTEVGKDIYETVMKGYRDIEFANVIARSKNDIKHGKLSIGSPLHVATFFLMDKINKAINDYPELQIKLDCGIDYREMIDKIKNNAIEFALLDFVPKDNMKGFEVQELFDTEYIFVSKEKCEIDNINDLNNCKFITSDNYRFSTLELRKAFREKNLELNQSMICSMMETRVAAAKAGLGIAYVIKEFVKNELENKELYEVKVPIKLPKTTVCLVYLKDRLTKVDKKFINDYLKK